MNPTDCEAVQAATVGSSGIARRMPNAQRGPSSTCSTLNTASKYASMNVGPAAKRARIGVTPPALWLSTVISDLFQDGNDALYSSKSKSKMGGLKTAFSIEHWSQCCACLDELKVTTVEDLLVCPRAKLYSHPFFSYGEGSVYLEIIQRAVWEAVCVKPNRWAEIPSLQRLSIGCATLDNILKGGVCSSGLVEVSGEAGVGKTQFCLFLCIQTLLREMEMEMEILESNGLLNKSTKVMYICTEKSVPMKRMEQMATNAVRKNYIATHNKPPTAAVHVNQTKMVMQRLYVEHVYIHDEMDRLLARLPRLFATGGVKLVVIDSIAALFRGEEKFQHRENMLNRTKVLWRWARVLLELQQAYQCTVVLVNQVGATLYQNNEQFESNANPHLQSNSDSNFLAQVLKTSPMANVHPALGLSWSHCIKSRLFLSRATTRSEIDQGQVVVRRLDVVFDPQVPPNHAFFTIQDAGLVSHEP